MSVPLVSAIIPTYNYERYIAAAVESALAQTYPNVEIIVVDDGGKDNTAHVLERFDSRVRYIYQENQGVAGARNTAINAARGQYIAFLDADDMWHPRRLELGMRYLSEHPEVGVVASAVIPELSDSGWPVVPDNWPPPATRYSMEQLCICARFAPCGALVRRECFDQVGLFNPQVSGADDRDMFIRIASRSAIDYLQWPLALYRIHGSNTSFRAAYMEAADHRMIDHVFSCVPSLRGCRVLRRKAMSYVACMSAISHTASGDERGALRRIIDSLWLWPFGYERGSKYSVTERLKTLAVILLRIGRLKKPYARVQLA